jgi:hypothetical protein
LDFVCQISEQKKGSMTWFKYISELEIEGRFKLLQVLSVLSDDYIRSCISPSISSQFASFTKYFLFFFIIVELP